MQNNVSDIIIALSTPPGSGAIGVIRLSGNGSIALVNQYFSGVDLDKKEGNTIHFGKVVSQTGRIIDESLVSIFRAPKSYTKEDVVEISCHGSSYIIQSIISLFLSVGARQAGPGEFTLRAFLAGQMDLSQAEAVADLIAADTAGAHDLALQQMRGGFSQEIKSLRQELIDFASLIELELDFGEEDVEFADRDKLKNLVTKIQVVIKRLMDSFQLGNVIKHGVSTVIAGRPNAGKSTLLNAFVNEDRAIVSEIAGTTRDTIEESLNIKGIQFRLIDTAGIRAAQNAIEQIGIGKTMEKMQDAKVVIYVFDVLTSTPKDLHEDVAKFLDASSQLTAGSKQIFVANKMDLDPYTKPEDYYLEGLISKENLIPISAKNNMNIEHLKDVLYTTVVQDPSATDQSIVSNIRHKNALQEANISLDTVLHGLSTSGMTGDLIALDIRQALYHLGLITGEVSTDDLLDSIFTRFCIGK
jgi:tRNA modification GTPase